MLLLEQPFKSGLIHKVTLCYPAREGARRQCTHNFGSGVEAWVDLASAKQGIELKVIVKAPGKREKELHE